MTLAGLLDAAAQRPALRRACRLAVPLAIGAAAARRRLGLPRPLSAAAAAAAPVGFAIAAPHGRVRAAGTWALQMWAYKVLFELPNEPAWRARARLHIDYPITADRMLCAGRPLPQRLQSALRSRLADDVFSVTYMTWDVAPHAVLAWLLWRRPDRFGRAAVLLGATIDLTLVGYWLVPTAPPWWSAQVGGRMGGEVHRVFTETRRHWRGQPRYDGHDSRGANPWAAMPSDHFGSAAMLAMLLAELGPGAGALGWGYAAALGTSLAYLGEHYATDMFAGLALALAVRRSERPLRAIAGV
jgi:membrane-associated phospholipid phosphatase